ncbi:hypothetical protein CAEBREN_25385 [Caenorhabditis brenneri]|uniref:PAN-3 domain-containing protein n=1 Tax=Caenorhabditis brenneri TaxID=135651 RepID=G0NPD5_CAEBE|nr:hypothetical protein CAEBREN_25385 [Caenorhabditis brenneri]
MLLHFNSILLIFSQLPTTLCLMKMIKFHGKVDVASFPIQINPDENCFEDCFQDNYCLMAYLDESVECYHYRYTSRPKTIVVKDLKDESVVAIKAIIPPDLLSTCPSTHDSLDFTMTIPSGDTYSWTKTPDGYSLNPCRDTWKSFSRTDGNIVCLQIFQVNNIDQPAAKKFCMDREANLTGVASVEETVWMHETLEEIPPVIEFDSFWIDGERQCAEGYQCDTIIWSDGYTTSSTALDPGNFWASYVTSTNVPEQCLTIAHLPRNPGIKINDIECSKTRTTLGVVCGYALL